MPPFTAICRTLIPALLCAVAGSAVSAAPGPAAASTARSAQLAMPCLALQQDFLKLPAGKFLGDVSGVAVGPDGHVWVLHRPLTLTVDQRPNALPPASEFSPTGSFLGGFGGHKDGQEWPRVEHSIALTQDGRVWISGNFRADPAQADDMLLEFTRSGQFLRQVGKRGASTGDGDLANFHAPGDLAVDWPNRELYVADGYGNRRVAVVDIASGRFKRTWGAFGSVPTLAPAPAPRTAGAPFTPDRGDGPPDFNGVHGVGIARDGKVYVSDRNNQRIQVFTRQGRYLGQVFIDRNLPSPTTASGMAFSADPAQRYLYVADFGNSALVVVDRRRLAVVGRIGKGTGSGPDLNAPHLMASNGKGQLFVSEVAARRVTRITVAPRCSPQKR